MQQIKEHHERLLFSVAVQKQTLLLTKHIPLMKAMFIIAQTTKVCLPHIK